MSFYFKQLLIQLQALDPLKNIDIIYLNYTVEPWSAGLPIMHYACMLVGFCRKCKYYLTGNHLADMQQDPEIPIVYSLDRQNFVSKMDIITSYQSGN